MTEHTTSAQRLTADLWAMLDALDGFEKPHIAGHYDMRAGTASMTWLPWARRAKRDSLPCWWRVASSSISITAPGRTARSALPPRGPVALGLFAYLLGGRGSTGPAKGGYTCGS